MEPITSDQNEACLRLLDFGKLPDYDCTIIPSALRGDGRRQSGTAAIAAEWQDVGSDSGPEPC